MNTRFTQQKFLKHVNFSNQKLWNKKKKTLQPKFEGRPQLYWRWNAAEDKVPQPTTVGPAESWVLEETRTGGADGSGIERERDGENESEREREMGLQAAAVLTAAAWEGEGEGRERERERERAELCVLEIRK